MCGICGFYWYDGQQQADPSLLQGMTDTLLHRGPDEAGYFRDAHVALGHRRLSIIDRASGQQPIFNEDGSKVIIFNGEIYNYRELFEWLLSKGHRFKTRSDTEVILHLYEELGDRCVERLRGMFAFAIWDQQSRTLFLARDRLGVKPLYYALLPSRCVFGSELKAIIHDPSVPRELDLETLDHYFSLLYVPSPRTIFRHVSKLPPGHTLTVSSDSATLRQYWDVQFDPQRTEGMTESAIADRLLELLTECVDIRLMSEVPLGAFLSGGIDSSAIVALMSRLTGKPVQTAAIGFQEDQYNELPYARLVAEKFKADHNEYIVEAKASEVIDKLAWHFDEPFADASAVPTYYVSRMARQRVTVALSGDGGDENFAGYRRYYFDLLENRLRSYLPGWVRSSVIAGVARIYPKADWLPQFLRAKTLLTNLSLPPEEGYFRSVSGIEDSLKVRLLSADFRGQLNGHSRASDLLAGYFERSKAPDPLSAVQYVDIKTYLADDICTKVDRASMANSLEVRNPFLDHRLVEFAAGIHWQHKLRKTEGKHILKRTLHSLLPPEILYRRKMGFRLPIARWLRHDLLIFSQERLEVLGRRHPSIFDSKSMHGLLQEHRSGFRDHSTALWALLMFQMWDQTFLASGRGSG
ncbi:MAG: asparagine synthase (glutamine-hydrolyzing) [Acidobacteria bacterium]|nr:asparagine synthase (glutamine-hydrolyzing) [Acidobacteriota bacterium]